MILIMGAKYQLRDMGELEENLGIKRFHDRSVRTLTLVQDKYATKILKYFHREDCLGASTLTTELNTNCSLELSLTNNFLRSLRLLLFKARLLT